MFVSEARGLTLRSIFAIAYVGLVESFGVDSAGIKSILSDPAPVVTGVTGAAFVTTAMTLTVPTPSGTAYTTGMPIKVAGLVGFAGTPVNGNFVVASQTATTVVYTLAGTPTGAYVSGGVVTGYLPTTFGSLIQIPAIKTVTVSGKIKEEDLRGDGQLIDHRAKLLSIDVAFNHGQLSFAEVAAALGGAQSTTGTTPNQVTTYQLLGTDPALLRYKFECQSLVGADTPGDLHFVAWKCQANVFPGLGFADEAFHIFTGGAVALPLRGAVGSVAAKWFDIVANETATAIG